MAEGGPSFDAAPSLGGQSTNRPDYSPSLGGDRSQWAAVAVQPVSTPDISPQPPLSPDLKTKWSTEWTTRRERWPSGEVPSQQSGSLNEIADLFGEPEQLPNEQIAALRRRYRHWEPRILTPQDLTTLPGQQASLLNVLEAILSVAVQAV